MNPRTSIFLAAALLLSPPAVQAQSAPRAMPAAPPAPAVAPLPEGAPDDDAPWMNDTFLAFDEGEDLMLAGTDLEGGETEGAADMAQAPDPPGGGGAGAMGRGMGPGMRRGWGGGRPMMRRGMALRMRLAQLDLTDAQRTRLRDLRDASARKSIQRRADIALARLDLQRLMRAEKPEVGAVDAQIDRIARLRADGAKAAFELRMQARAVLTPEQLKKLRAPMAPGMRGGAGAPEEAPER